MNKKKLVYAMTVSESCTLIDTQMKSFKCAGYDVTLVTADGHEAREISRVEGICYVPLNMVRNPSPVRDIFSLLSAIRLLFKLRPDIVIASTPKAGFIFILASFITRVPHRIYYIRGLRHESLSGIARKVQLGVEKISALLSTRTICLSDSVHRIVVNSGISTPNKSSIIGNGGSGTPFLTFKNENSIPDEYKYKLQKIRFFTEGSFVVGFVGRLIPRKGLAELIEAHKMIRSKGINVVLLLIGSEDATQPLDPHLKKYISSDPSVVTSGHIPRNYLAPFYFQMDVFAFPTYWEGFGNVLIEAAYHGIPIISTRVSGCVDSVNDGVNGILVEKGNSIAVHDSILLLYENLELRRAMGSQGKKWALKFDRVVVNKNWVKYLKSLEA